jgi:hypothetical protein
MSEPTYEELKARLSQLEKQVENKKRSGAMEFRVSEKGGVSVYGLGRFPVSNGVAFSVQPRTSKPFLMKTNQNSN